MFGKVEKEIKKNNISWNIFKTALGNLYLMVHVFVLFD